MENKLARTISVIFHPLLFPSYLILIIFNLDNYVSLLIPTEAKIFIFFLVFAVTFVIPAIFILILKKRGLISSLHLESREERVYPFLIAGIFNFTAFYVLKQVQIPDVYYRLFLGSTILILICLIVNFYSKISAHLAGTGGCAGSLLGFSLRFNHDLILLIVLVIFISGLIGYARLKLNAHKPVQIYTGFIAGLIVMMTFLLI